jgi:predicted lipoprotein with Yx(FWY)xxD motif
VNPIVRRAALAGVTCGALVLGTGCGGYGTTAGDGGYGEPVAAAATPTKAGAPAAGDAYGGGYDQPAGAPAAAVPRGALIAKTVPKMGAVVTDAKGWVLYRFDADTRNAAASACVGTCAKVWPPAVTSGKPQLTGIDADKVDMVKRSDGRWQLSLGGWLLYRYAGDRKPGQWRGQGVGGKWWVSAPTGAKNLTCVPKGVPKPVAPPADGDY